MLKKIKCTKNLTEVEKTNKAKGTNEANIQQVYILH
jgi:hypothetical protein